MRHGEVTSTEEETSAMPVGVRGLGDIGVEAAMANPVFHALGKRHRDLPITPDRLV